MQDSKAIQQLEFLGTATYLEAAILEITLGPDTEKLTISDMSAIAQTFVAISKTTHKGN